MKSDLVKSLVQKEIQSIETSLQHDRVNLTNYRAQWNACQERISRQEDQLLELRSQL